MDSNEEKTVGNVASSTSIGPSAVNPGESTVASDTLDESKKVFEDDTITQAQQTPAGRSNVDTKITPIQDHPPTKIENDDLEAIYPVNSGPAYSAFSDRQRQYIVFMVACGGFFSPLSANIYFPALNALSRDLKVSSSLINLSLTTYMIFQGLAPTIFGDLADMTGRRPVYILGFIIYIGANIGLALQNNYAALLVLRCLQSTGSSGTVALGNGVVADIATSGERGKFIGANALITSPFQELISNRHCPTWCNDSACHSTCRGWDYYPTAGLEMAFLVFNHTRWRVSSPLGHCIS